MSQIQIVSYFLTDNNFINPVVNVFIERDSYPYPKFKSPANIGVVLL
ncbi:MAG: hypothetical protein CM15mP121_2860 [Bacteroidota bacterium]|nr:MAG: hypothetical protein CM15mP121_2860 [Bacteroidota bacterium]